MGEMVNMKVEFEKMLQRFQEVKVFLEIYKMLVFFFLTNDWNGPNWM